MQAYYFCIFENISQKLKSEYNDGYDDIGGFEP